MDVNLATDDELIAAIARTAQPASIVKLNCGDIRIISRDIAVGTRLICFENDCPVLGTYAEQVIPTSIV